MARRQAACYDLTVMSRRTIPLLSIALAAPLVAVAAAQADCLCVANGVRFTEGQFTCLKLPTGARLARCEKVLNNTSWTILESGCLQVSQLNAADSAPAPAFSP